MPIDPAGLVVDIITKAVKAARKEARRAKRTYDWIRAYNDIVLGALDPDRDRGELRTQSGYYRLRHIALALVQDAED